MPNVTFYCHVVILNDIVYVGGGGANNVVFDYHPGRGEWSELPTPHVLGFAMASLNAQLVLVGGIVGGEVMKILRVWEGARGGWAHPYPAMSTGRSESAAVGYQHYLIVACGKNNGGVDTVEVLDGSSHTWYSAQPVPMGGYEMSSVVIGDHWYLSSFYWEDENPHIFTAHLPTLVSSAVSPARTSSASIWQELPTPPVDSPTLLALQNHLLLVGGRGPVNDLHHYDPLAKKYSQCGQLPFGMYGPSCAVLPSGELMVAGGEVEGGEVEGIGWSRQVWWSRRVWIGSIVSLHMRCNNYI